MIIIHETEETLLDEFPRLEGDGESLIRFVLL